MWSLILRNKLFFAWAILIAAGVAFLYHPSNVFWARLPVETNDIQPAKQGGHGYEIYIGFENYSADDLNDSPVVLIEDGVPLGPSNALLDRISGKGLGRYTFREGILVFSTLDNSDPRTNHRIYRLLIPVTIPFFWHVTFGLLVANLVFIVPWNIILPINRLSAEQARTISIPNRTISIPNRLKLGIILSTIALLLIPVMDLLPVLRANNAASAGVYQRTVDLHGYKIKPYGGYYAFDVSQLGISSLAAVFEGDSSKVILLENGIPLTSSPLSGTIAQTMESAAPGVSLHARYQPTDLSDSYTNEKNKQDLIFFIPTGGDPAQNTYTLLIPASRADAYALRYSDLERRSVWVVVLLAYALGAWLIKKSIGGISPLIYQIPLITALFIAYALMTGIGIIRVQPCLPAGAYSYWDVFCVSPDSTSYYAVYTPTSPRGPGYPFFIRAIAGDWKDLDAIFKTQPPAMGAWIADDLNPLMRVSRVQMTLLLLSGLALCFMMMRRLGSPLVAVFFLFFFDFHLYIFHEFNQILTESLTQTWLLLIVVCFIGFIWKEDARWFFPAAIFAGLSYLTRQASIYAAGFLFAMILWAIVKNWRAYWRASLYSILALAFLLALPDIFARILLGGSAQENLTYQYRAVYALRLAEREDIQYMPDQESREWLAESLDIRDQKDKEFDKMCNYEEYCMWVYRIESTYEVAITQAREYREPSFYIMTSDIIIKRHFWDYPALAFDGWLTAMTSPQVDRIQIIQAFFGLKPVSPYYVYAIAFLLALALRGKHAYVSVALILAHWAHLYISCLFSAPIQRIVWASDGLPFIAFFILGLEASRRLVLFSKSGLIWFQGTNFLRRS